MSCNYAENLSYYENKGKLGLPEIFDSVEEVERKSIQLAELMKKSCHTVVHTGAGVSTAAGIPDFRGPNGVWTLEKKGQKPSTNISWDDAKPTKTHMALFALHKAGYIKYIVTQNIDGLHLRSGIPRSCLSELHGNLFVDECGTCKRQFVRQEAVETVGLKTQGISCPGRRANGRRCRGKLFDTILDWEDSLPDNDLELAHLHSCCADLSLCLGTTLQILPSGNLPVHTKKRGGTLVICNLQPTKQDKQADLVIHTYVDHILARVLQILEIPIPDYDVQLDPVKVTRASLSHLGYPVGASKQTPIPEWPTNFRPVEWTIKEEWVKDKKLIEKSKSRKIIKAKKHSRSKESCVPYQLNSSTVATENGEFECENKHKYENEVKQEREVKVIKLCEEGCERLKQENLVDEKNKTIKNLEQETLDFPKNKYKYEEEVKQEKEEKVIKLSEEGYEQLKQENSTVKNLVDEKNITLKKIEQQTLDFSKIPTKVEMKIETF